MSAQAISVSVPANPGVWRALLWKEWRQQRWVALPLAALPTALYWIIFAFVSNMYRHEAGAVPAAVLLLASLIIGASAFCGERDDETAEFLRQMPSGGPSIFLAKLLHVWGTVLAGALLIGISAAVGSTMIDYPAVARHVQHESFIWRTILILGCFVLFLMLLGILPALVSAWARRTLPCILLSVAAAVGLWAWTSWMANLVYWNAQSVADRRWLFWPIAVVIISVIVCAPWFWIWSRQERTSKARIGVAIIFIAALAIISTAPLCVEIMRIFEH